MPETFTDQPRPTKRFDDALWSRSETGEVASRSCHRAPSAALSPDEPVRALRDLQDLVTEGRP
jgi:hypothetical protein